MATSPTPEVSYTGDGSTTDFAITFDYAQSSEVYVSVDGIDTAFEFVDAGTVRIDPAPAADAGVRVYRSTDVTEMRHVFELGAPFVKRTIDENNTQLQQAIQENTLDAKAALFSLLRTIRAADSEDELVGLVDAATRANRVLYFDADGQPATAGPTFDGTELAASIIWTPPTSGTAIAFKRGRVYFDSSTDSLSYHTGTATVIRVGQSLLLRVSNTSGASIPAGRVVYLAGVSANIPTIQLASASSPALSETIGVTVATIPHSSFGYVMVCGEVRDIDTSAWAANTRLFLSQSVPGTLTSIEPPTGIKILIGRVLVQNATTGRVLVCVDRLRRSTDGYSVDETDALLADKADADTVVTINTTQTVTAQKTFTAGIVANSITGTAVTQSTTDATAGRLYKVGDYTVAARASASDLNTEVTPQRLSLTIHDSGRTNAPPGTTSAQSMLTWSYESSGVSRAAQLVATHDDAGRLFFRKSDLAGAWASWVELLHTGNSGSTGLANGTSDVRIPTANTDIVARVGGAERLRVTINGISVTNAASTAAGPSANSIIIPNTVGNRGGLAVANSAGGTVAGITAELMTAGAYPSSAGQLDLWVQNGASTVRGARINQNGFVLLGQDTSLGTFRLQIRETSNSRAVLVSASGVNSDAGIGYTNDARSWSAGVAGYASDAFIIRDVTASQDRLSIATDGGVSIGGTLQTNGAYTNQQASSNAVQITLRSSFPTPHPFTSLASTGDVFARLRAFVNSGLYVDTFSSGSNSATIFDCASQSPTTNGTFATFRINVKKSDGATGAASMTNDEDAFAIQNNGGLKFLVKAGGAISTGGEASPDVDPGGICINTGTNDGNALTLKNADVAHPFTSFAEADTYCFIKKGAPTTGGMFTSGFGTGDFGVYIRGFAQVPSTANSGTGNASVTIDARTGATGLSPADDNDNLFAVKNTNTMRLLVKGNGDLYLGGRIATGGETSPDVGSGGLCLFVPSGLGADNSISIKGTSTAHSFTAIDESDTFAALKPLSSAGGLFMKGLSTSSAGVAIRGYGASTNTGALTTGVIRIGGSRLSGSSGTALAYNDTVLSFENNAVAVAAVKGDGAIVSEGTCAFGVITSLPSGTGSVTTYLAGTVPRTQIFTHSATSPQHVQRFPEAIYDGQEYHICTRSEITSFSTATGGPTIYGGFSSSVLAANAAVAWIYSASANAWFRLK